MAARRFPDAFVWGTATSAHQVEGGNWNNDWWMWEHDPASPCQEPRGDARLGDVMGRACTLNEPNIVATFGYLHGLFPPGKRDPDLRRRVNDVFIDARRKATAAIRSGPGRPAVGLVLAMSDCQAVPGGEAERDRYRRDMEDVFLEATAGDDFFGVQCYSRTRFGPEGMLGPERGVRL